MKFLRDHASFIPPSDPSRRRSGGKLQISFLVHENGTLSHYIIDRSTAKNLDEEMLQALKKADGLWEPGRWKGEKVNERFIFAMNFEVN